MPDSDLAALARRQHGLVTAAQAASALTVDQIRHRIRIGRLERVHPGVLRVAGAPEGWEPALMGAVLAAGEGAVGSFRAAAHLWGLAGFWEAPPIEITTPTRRRTRLDDVVVHDSAVLDCLHVDRRRGIPVTSVASLGMTMSAPSLAALKSCHLANLSLRAPPS